MSSSQGDWRFLESAVEEYLRRQGYEVQRNLTLVGLSGARHEIDVYAEKDDGVTRFKIAVECKAWDKPVQKEVIFKISEIVRDLSLNKAIVVSRAGSRLGSDQTAKHLGIDIWGPEDIAKNLSDLPRSGIESEIPLREALGFPVSRRLTESQMAREFKLKRALFGRGESVEASGLLWIPLYLVDISYTTMDQKARPERLISRRTLNVYDAIVGTAIGSFPNEPQLSSVDISDRPIQPLITALALERRLLKPVNKKWSIRRSSDLSRLTSELAAVGLPYPLHSVEFDTDKIQLFYVPYFAGIVRDKESQRVGLVHAYQNDKSGHWALAIARLLTSNLRLVRTALLIR